MKITIWGTRGSIPAPLSSAYIEEKIYQAILDMPPMNTQDPEAVRAYVSKLPPTVRGTAGGNTACVEVQANGQLIVLDAGSGLYPLGLELMKGPFGKGQGTMHLFISHTHWDHIQGFPMFTPAFVPGNRIFIYGAHDLETAFEIQQRPLTWPVSLAYMSADIQFVRVTPGEPLFIDKVRIETLKNAHPGDAYSYRVEDQHSVFVYASDAEYKKLEDDVVNPYVTFFRNADALVFDAMYTLQDAWIKEDWGHSSAMIGVDLAEAAGVRQLILFHHDPSYSDAKIEEIYATADAYRNQRGFTLETIVAYEGMTFDLTPPGAMDLQFTPNGETAIVTPTSIFDEHGIDALARQLTEMSDPHSPTSSIIDLSQVETFTTASLKSLVAFRQQWLGKPIILANPPQNVQHIIELGGCADFFTVYPSVKAALSAVHAREALNLQGQVIKNRYRIESKIGESLLGTVLKATDTEENRTVVLKILSSAFSPATIERFMQQTQQIVALDHPNIVEVFAWDREENYVLSVEAYVPHPTLQDFLNERQIDADAPRTPSGLSTSPAYLLEIALDVISALEYAHSHGVVLGDLKPQNIFLTPQGARLTGIGLGRLEEGRNLLDTPRLFLTADYLAPEQILGEALDARTDLYAFGVMMYQLFTGHRPFEEPARGERATSADTSEQAILQSHLRYSPRRPRDFNNPEGKPQISASLDHLILKLLDKNPNNRYASAQQVRRILSNLLSDIESAVRPSSQILVGREKQVQMLRACWEEAAAGHGQLAFITGEPGIGKTRLAQQVAAQSHPPVLLVGHCEDSEGQPAYRLFTEVLREYLNTVPPEFFNTEARQQLANFASLIPEIHQMLPELHVAPPLDPKQEQLRLMTSLTQFIRRATQERPWFLVLEDLQWADISSLALLLYLGRHIPTMPIFILGTYSDIDVERGHPLLETLRGLHSHPTYRHVPLQRLTQDEVEMALTYLWSRTVPEALVEKIYAQTAGNPFYMEEVAKVLEDDGLIPSSDTTGNPKWLEQALQEVRLPQSARETVWRRIERLSTETRGILRQAAVLGQSFRFEDLQRMSGLSEWQLLERLDEAFERQLIEEIPSGTQAHGPRLRFRQTEIQDVIYADLGPLRRRLLHRKAGEALEHRATGKIGNAGFVDALAEELAYHFGEANEIDKTIGYSLQAARQAQQTYANATALQWYTRVLEILHRAEPEVVAHHHDSLFLVHQSSGSVRTLIGQYDEALAHYAVAQALLEAQPSSDAQRQQMAELCYEIAAVYELRDEYDTVLAWLQRGLKTVAELAPTVEAARIYLLGAKVYSRQGDNSQALAWCQKSLDIAMRISGLEGTRAHGAALYTQAGIDMRLGNLDNAIQFCQESIRAYQKIGDLTGESNAHINLGSAYVLRGNWEEAGAAYRRGWAIKREIGDVYGQAISSNNLANLHLKRGEWQEAHDMYMQSLSTWQNIRAPRGEAVALINLAQVHIHQQEWARAQEYLHRSQTLLDDIGSKEFLPELERLWGEYYLKTGDIDQAMQHTQHAITMSQTYSDPLEAGIAHRLLGQIHFAQAAPHLAEKTLRTSLEMLSHLNNEHEIAKTKLTVVQLAVSEKIIPFDEAQTLLREAIETFEKLGALVDLAQARALQQDMG